jgi:hypothetical protein
MRQVWYSQQKQLIKFGNKVNSYIIRDFSSAIDIYLKSKTKALTVDFSFVTQAYPNGMLGVISTVANLRALGHRIDVILPTNFEVRKLFRNGNWAHFLSPEQNTKSESFHDRHLVTRQFVNNKEQTDVVNDFMDVILRNMEVPKDIISGIEWSINEITDNVLNHSESKTGGFIQVSTYPKSATIAFAVGDSGRGILKSLKEGIPTLRTDSQAIGEAIKAGVTRNSKFGQGNGLAGSLRVTTMTGGSLDITSGTGRLVATVDETKKNDRYFNQSYQGTLVCGQIKMSKDFSIIKALDFGGTHPYVAVNIIDSQYEMEDSDCLLIKMKAETTGYGSRNSGRQLRTKTLNLINSKPDFPIIIDWSGIPVISSSFADEFIGKLFLEIGAMAFSAKIRNQGMEELIKNLLDKAISQRLTQAKDEDK